LHLEGHEFVTSDEIKKFCTSYKLDYYNTIRYLTSKGYLLRIFKGIFYIKSFDEFKLGKIKYSHLELVSKGMELKKGETIKLRYRVLIHSGNHETADIAGHFEEYRKSK